MVLKVVYAVAYLNLTYEGKNHQDSTNQLKGQEKCKNNRASKLEKIKNTELQQKLSGSY